MFFVAIRFDPDTPERMQELENMELPGVKGISASKEIVLDFLGVARDALIVMPAQKVLEMNKITRFMYDGDQYQTISLGGQFDID